MPIEFKTPGAIQQVVSMAQMVAEQVMRPKAAYYDEHEHEIPWEYINMMWPIVSQSPLLGADDSRNGHGEAERKRSPITNVRLIHIVEMLSWGDAGQYLCTPGGNLGAAAIAAVGTPEQKRRFLSRFQGEKPAWGAMAMTEPQAGSDTSAIKTTAVRDGDFWVLNGEKIFCTGGRLALEESNGLVVVWATVDPKAGRAGMKPFVVEAGTPGVTVTKLEPKLGIRASDTASILLQDARIPFDHILGSPEVISDTGGEKGFKGAMKTFDATRPIVAASALGIARATIEYVKHLLNQEGITIRYGAPLHQLSAVELEVMDMEAQHRAAWLLTQKAAWMMDMGLNNNLEASMCKVKAGDAVTRITQKAVEILGPLGYSRAHPVEKWMRDAKINDIFEGTGQINRLIVARRILGYTSRELK
ncbi:MAG: acyl-CoA dehydrogenase [Herpetosiphonaceae bacterium]|nr:MAG: acyl-CoA dehydrogenase [Herpetosiphonaceae bacterium]